MRSNRRARPSTGVLLAASILLLGETASAQSWEVEYDPGLGTRPSAQGWTHDLSDPPPDDGLDEGNYLVSLGILTQGDTGGPNADAANRQAYELVPPDFDFDEDVLLVEFRLKILSSTQTVPGAGQPGAGFAVRLVDAAQEEVTLYVGSSDLFMLQGTPLIGTPAVSFDATLDFADYQLRVDRSGASLRVNGSELLTLERDDFLGSIFPPNLLEFGDVNVFHTSSSQLEGIGIARFRPETAEVRHYEVITQTTPVVADSSDTKTLTIPCPAGTRALSGGASTIGADGSVGITETRPSGGPPATSWTGSAREFSSTGADWQLRVDVICGEVPGYENVAFADPLDTAAEQLAGQTCANGKTLIGGGAGFQGTDLNQVLTSTWLKLFTFVDPEREWFAGADDYGATTSSGAWAVESHAICSSASGFGFETVRALTAVDGTSPKQLPVNCPGGKVPVGGGAAITVVPEDPQDMALRASRPKDGAPGEPPVGWWAEAQATNALWQLQVVVVCAPVADPTLSKTGLVGRWRGEFDAEDSWGRGAATLENGAGFAPGVFGQAFSLDATSEQWVRAPSVILLDENPVFDLYPEASFTASAWIQTSTLQPGTVTEVLNLYDFGGLNGGGGATENGSSYYLRLTADGYGFGSVRDPTGTSTTATGTIPLADGEPHHMAVSRDLDTNQLTLYVDGAVADDTALILGLTDSPLFPGNPNNPDPLSIGIHRNANSSTLARPFHGLIDDVTYHDRALTLEEIQNIAGCGVPVVPRVLNLEAALFGSRVDADHGLCVFLEAGEYDLTLVTPALDPDARFTAWSPDPAALWGTAYRVEPEIDAAFTTGLPIGAGSAQQAFDDTNPKQVSLTLSSDQRVHFSLTDDEVLDNRGGVSVRVEFVPEPGGTAMLAAGIALLAGLSRHRRHRGRSTARL